MKGTTMGIDIAKNVFEVYGEDKAGQMVDRRRLSRKKMLPWLANRPPALVSMEACAGAHYSQPCLWQYGNLDFYLKSRDEKGRGDLCRMKNVDYAKKGCLFHRVN
jgi:hypothetical protein